MSIFGEHSYMKNMNRTRLDSLGSCSSRSSASDWSDTSPDTEEAGVTVDIDIMDGR